MEERDLNTVKTKCRKAPLTTEERAYLVNGFSAIGTDRCPFAIAEIRGNSENQDVIGEANFYHTPLGILVSVWMKGFSGGRETYHIRIEDACDGRKVNCVLPPLYERGGYAFFSSLTGKLSAGEILNKRIYVGRYCNSREQEIALGYVAPAFSVSGPKKRAKIV